MGRIVALATLAIMATPAFGLTFISLSVDMFESGTYTVNQDDFIVQGYSVPDALLPGFMNDEEEIAFPEM